MAAARKKKIDADNKKSKERPQNKHLKPIPKGTTLNPHGRPKGSRNKFGEEFLQVFLADFEQHGAEAVQKCREKHVETYVRVAASILPKELNIKDESTLDKILDQFGIEQLDAILVAIAGNGIRAQGAKQKDKAAITGQSTRIH